MKQFHFSLERALAWRRTQARMERAKWEHIRAEIAAIDKAVERLTDEKRQSAAELRAQKVARSEELEALETFGEYVIHEQDRLKIKRAECEKRLAEQATLMIGRERDVKVLEHLRSRRLEAWRRELDRETEQQAAEAYLARWQVRS